MSSVASTGAAVNPGVADLLQMISNTASPALSSLLSSTNVQSALQNASPAGLVQLSDQALQLQVVEGLFGDSETSQTDGLFGTQPASSPSTTLDNLIESLTQPASGSTSSESTASQLAIYQSQLQTADTEALFGTTSDTANTPVNLLA